MPREAPEEAFLREPGSRRGCCITWREVSLTAISVSITASHLCDVETFALRETQAVNRPDTTLIEESHQSGSANLVFTCVTCLVILLPVFPVRPH